MKKIGLVTFHRAVNYGAMLQAVALQRAIKDMGEESELIDYVDELYDHYKISYKSSNPIKTVFKYILSGKVRLKSKRFDTFLAENADVSARRYSRDDIGQLNENEYRLFFTGSDQVFNPRIVDFDDTYLLSFVEDKDKCCSYAASIGFSDLNEQEKNWLCENIKNYRTILIREKTGQELLNQIGICNSDLVCDPTFLLGKESWETMERKITTPKHYILCYGFGKNPYMKQCSTTLSEKTGFPICEISDAIVNSKSEYQFYRGIGPAEWLYLIHHADYIVTNSFHGMVFSFIYGRQVLITDCNDGTFSRLNDFLREMDCQNCVVDHDTFNLELEPINYVSVMPRLESYIASSKRILQMILSHEEE